MASSIWNIIQRALDYCCSNLKEIIFTRHLKTPEQREQEARCEITCDLSDERTFFAWQRNHMANERTFLAWCRTGISLIVFAFVIERFDLLIRELRIFATNPETLMRYTSKTHYLGVITFILGGVIIILAGWRFFYIRRHINRGEIEFSTVPDVFLMTSVLATLFLTFFMFMFLF